MFVKNISFKDKELCLIFPVVAAGGNPARNPLVLYFAYVPKMLSVT
jgi:hypothetical protein